MNRYLNDFYYSQELVDRENKDGRKGNNMWVRSQDKRNFINTDNINRFSILNRYDIVCYTTTNKIPLFLATYDTEERTMEVMDKLVNQCISNESYFQFPSRDKNK